ncbi:ASI1-immunoprecipitated protein 2-like isoform X2 [Tasmannia lanceolata]|uniref:ASI1-immunoprecipitated protein 2-like isoform X2 n=2 Tax=Tasmannia lanceolata TaxID=3420 RepID=UPI0040638316
MTNRKERALIELYDLTDKLLEPEITPVLKGSCRIQGPVDESDHDLQDNMEASPSEKKISKGSLHKNVRMRAESGICNVCVTPCSSCMHFNRFSLVMESKIEDECSEEIFKGKEKNRSSYNDSETSTACEASNLLSASSRHNLFSENAESEAAMRTFDTSYVSKNAPGHVHNCHREIVESGHNPRRPSTCPKDDFREKGSDITFDDASLPQKSDPTEFPSSKDVYVGKTSPKLQLPCTNSRSDNSFICSGDAKDLEENSSSQHRGEPFECSYRQKSTVFESSNVLLRTEGSKGGQVRSNYSYEAPMKVYPCLDTEIDMNVSGIREPSLHSQPISESEHSRSDILEDDVKVCDICGDAGREELLAICSRCSDGAEHTYCMSIMLDKVPEGDWLCEGCNFKEDDENKHPDEFGTVSETPTAPSLNERSQNNGGTFSPKDSPKLDIKSQEAESNRAVKVLASPPVSTERPADILDIASLSKTHATKPIVGSLGAVGPCKNIALSKESSFKNLDAGEVKPTTHPITSFGSHSTRNSQQCDSLGTSSPNSSRMLAQLKSPRSLWSSTGALLCSATLNSLDLKPKVKQVSENVSEKEKLARESASNDARKEGSIRMVRKSASFKDTSSDHLNATELKAKMQFSNISRAEDPRSLKLGKEQNLLERKNSFKSDRSIMSSSPKAATNVSLLKADLKIMSHCPKTGQHDVKSNTLSDQTVFVANKGPENAIVSDESNLKPYEKKRLSHVPLFANTLSSAMPEHDYIWQGGFEVQRSGKVPDLFDGIQAHLSTCASPKVLEVVNKFPYKVQLEKVPRLSSWPFQFQESCAKEDSIALYFFAKDLQSYERNYKMLLENLLKNDLALKGNLDGIELLIFASNQLPEKSQRWNRLFFLWAVFEGRENRSESSGSRKKLCSSNFGVEPSALDLPNPIMAKFTVPQKPSHKEDFRDSVCGKDTEVRPSNEATGVQSGLIKGKAVPIYLDRQEGSTSSSLVRQEPPNILPARSSSLVQEVGPQHSRDRKKMRDQYKARYMDNETLDGNMGNRKRQHSDSSETFSEASGESSKKSSQKVVFKEKMEVEGDRECKKMKCHSESSVRTSSQEQGLGHRLSPKILDLDPIPLEECKKMKCHSESSVRTSSQEESLGHRLSPKIFDLDPIPLEEQKGDCICSGTFLPENSGSTEIFFFPVDSSPVRDCKSGNSIPWQIISSDDEDQPESDVPNLELALGAKKKSPKKGILSIFPELLDDKNNRNKLSDPAKDEGDDDIKASLSLSLAFPFSKKERTVKCVSKAEELLPEKHHVNTSLLLFGGFPDNYR